MAVFKRRFHSRHTSEKLKIFWNHMIHMQKFRNYPKLEYYNILTCDEVKHIYIIIF